MATSAPQPIPVKTASQLQTLGSRPSSTLSGDAARADEFPSEQVFHPGGRMDSGVGTGTPSIDTQPQNHGGSHQSASQPPGRSYMDQSTSSHSADSGFSDLDRSACAPITPSPSLSLERPSFGNPYVPQVASRKSELVPASGQSAVEVTHANGHRRPIVTIDTSPTGLQRRSGLMLHARDRPSVSNTQTRPRSSTWTSASTPSGSWRQSTQSQLSLGLLKDQHPQTGAMTPPSINTDTSTLATPSSLESPPLSRSSTTTGDTTPSSPKSFVAPFKASFLPEAPLIAGNANSDAAAIPINRISRSQSVSSFASSNSPRKPAFDRSRLSAGLVTSTSYDSLPYSPAVAFLSNFVDSTLPVAPPDEEGSLVGDYILGKVIGFGGFSSVHEAFPTNIDATSGNGRVAVKIVKTETGATNNDRVQRMLDKEINIWSQVSHQNILPFIGVEKQPAATFIFSEICSGGNLQHYLTQDSNERLTRPIMPSSQRASRPGRTLDEDEARVIFNQVADAVRYLHEEKRIVHRDIKLENILQHESGTWKLCDFGLAEYQDEESASCFGDTLLTSPAGTSGNINAPDCGDSTVCTAVSSNKTEEEGDDEGAAGGSLAYCSPEQLRSRRPLRCPLSDVWSLGVVLYALLTGRLPFQDEYEPRLQLQILMGRYEEPMERSAEARVLLRIMFRPKAADRWHIGKVKDSPWCLGISGTGTEYDAEPTELRGDMSSLWRSKSVTF